MCLLVLTSMILVEDILLLMLVSMNLAEETVLDLMPVLLIWKFWCLTVNRNLVGVG